MKCKHCGKEIKKYSNGFFTDISGKNITEIYCHVDINNYPINSIRQYCNILPIDYAEPDIKYFRKMKLERIYEM
jgi:hypothetical protein